MTSKSKHSEALQSLLAQIAELDRESLNTLGVAINERLTALADQTRNAAMARFSVGDRVSFTSKQGVYIEANVIRLNKKTASLMTTEGDRWNVAPELLTLLRSAASEPESELPVQLSVLPGSGKSLGQISPSSETQVCEWVGGLVRTPGYIDEGDGPFRPSALVWMDSAGMVQGMDLCAPGDESRIILSSLDAALHEPQYGKPTPPTRIRTANPQIADVVKQHYTRIEVVIAATPEIDEFGDKMQDYAGQDQTPPTLMQQGLTPQSVAASFASLAKLYTAAPWKKIPTDTCLFSLSIESLNIQNAVISVIGQAQEHFGFLVFDSMSQYELYVLVGDFYGQESQDEHPEETGRLTYRSVTFVDGAELGDPQRKEVAKHNWPIANAHAYPDIFIPTGGRLARIATETDLAIFDALAQALIVVTKKLSLFKKAWSLGKRQVQTLQVTTLAGDVSVSLEAPYPAIGILQKMSGLVRSPDRFNWDAITALNVQLGEEFRNSAECLKTDFSSADAELLMEFLANYFEESVATAMPSVLEEVLFSLFPRKVMMPPEHAHDTIAALKSFYRFLERQYDLTQAKACLEVLDKNAGDRLAKALADPAVAGIGKSILNHASEAGFNIDSQEDLETFMQTMSGKPLPDSIQLPGYNDLPPTNPPSAHPKDNSKRKQKRKASRKARKKNR